jgi:hypothetical protein
MEKSLFLTKNKNSELDVFKQQPKKLVCEWISINGNFGT